MLGYPQGCWSRRRWDSTRAAAICDPIEMSSSAVPVALLLLIVGPGAHAQTLTAGGGITLKIEATRASLNSRSLQSGLEYSVAVDGADWLKSGPTAMTSGGVTYTSECASKDTCLALSGTPSKTSGTDVSHSTPCISVPLNLLPAHTCCTGSADGLTPELHRRVNSRRTGRTRRSWRRGSVPAAR